MNTPTAPDDKATEEVARTWPDPTPEMVASPLFEGIWQVIKGWDIAVPAAYAGYCGATGNHVRAILDAIAAYNAAVATPSVGALLPCHFCSSPNVIVDNFGGPRQFAATCENEECHAIGPERETKAEAVAAWNRRAAPQASDLTAARLMEALATAESETRRYSESYPQSSDGRNTFLMLADRISELARAALTGKAPDDAM